VYDASLLLGDIHQVRDRMATGSHLPHPRIAGRRVDSGTLSFERPLPVWADGTLLGRARHLEVFVVADALTVVI
jgi:diacylglycerol kinase family enzyme